MSRVQAALIVWFLWRILAALALNVWGITFDPTVYFLVSFLLSFGCLLHFGDGLSGFVPFGRGRWLACSVLGACILGLTNQANGAWWTEVSLNVRLVFAVAAGLWIGRRVENVSYVWPLVTVGLTMDLASLSMSGSFTHSVVQSLTLEPETPHPLLVYTPGGALHMPLFGLADIVFSMILVSAADSLKLNKARLIFGLWCGCVFGIGFVLWTASPIPLLPFLGVCGALSLGKAVQPTRHDLIQTFVFLVIVTSICALLWAK